MRETTLKKNNECTGGAWEILNKYGIYTIEEALKVGETLSLNIGMFTIKCEEGE